METTVETPSETPPRPGTARRALDVIDDRLGLTALQYPVPEHANNLAWSLGGMTAASLLVLIVTGVVLTQFFNPMPEEANASVRGIADDVWAGQLVRGVHFWAAQAMYVLAGIHLLRVFLTGSYRRPREANWLIGVAMFALVIGAIFTGTVIKWDQEGFEALAHNLEIGRLLGGAGFWFSAEFSADLPLIVRLYVAHVAIIPGLILGLLGVHFLLVKRHGISPHPAIADAPTEPHEPFTHHVRRLGAFGLVLLGGLLVLAARFPPGLGPTPVEGIEVTRPLWMFWWLFTLEDWWGSTPYSGPPSPCSRCWWPCRSSTAAASAAGAGARLPSVSPPWCWWRSPCSRTSPPPPAPWSTCDASGTPDVLGTGDRRRPVHGRAVHGLGRLAGPGHGPQVAGSALILAATTFLALRIVVVVRRATGGELPPRE